MAKQKPMPSPNATPNPSLSSSQAMQLLELRRVGVDQKEIDRFLENPAPVPEPVLPITDKEDQLIAILDSLGRFDEKAYEMQQTLGRMQKDIDRFEQKLDQVLELIKELGSNNDSGHHRHRE